MSKFILLKMDNISRYGYYNGVDIIFEKHQYRYRAYYGGFAGYIKRY